MNPQDPTHHHRRGAAATLLLLLLSFVVGLLAARPATAKKAPEIQVFKNVHVITMNPDDGPKVKKKRTVVIEDGEIVEIGKAKRVEIPEGAEVINAKKKYLLPGLWDMHAHGDGIPEIPEDVSEKDLYTMYFANGITGVFDPWGFKQVFKWRRAIERGKVVGPRLHFSSPGVNDRHFDTADEVEETVRTWAREGYTRIKTHGPITREKFERLHAVARELGLPVVGHAIRPGHTLEDTLEQGQEMLAHIEEILSVAVVFNRPETFQQDLAGPLVDVANSRIWVTGTVGTYDMIVKTVGNETFEALFDRPEMRYVPPSVHTFWREENIYRQDDFLQDPDFWARLLDVKLYIARELRDLGALDRLLLGTDSGIPHVIHGFSIHDELRLLVEAGLTPWEALLTGTYNPAVYLGLNDETGTVEEGKRADLFLVKKNPLRKISNLKKVQGVMVDGVWLSGETLDERLEELAARWED